MFVPRKLQKRSHAPSLARNGGADETPPAPGSAPSQTTEASRSLQAPQAPQASLPCPRAPSASDADAGKLDRLVEFLHARLSPLHVAFSARDEARCPASGAAWTELVAAITAQPSPAMHYSRLLHLVPGLATRCKSVSLVAEALALWQAGAGAGWFSLDAAAFRLTWSDAYVRLVSELTAQRADVVKLLQSRLVYVECIPPRVRARVQAAEYVARLLSTTKEAAPPVPAVLAVLEPAVVRSLMAGHTVDAGVLGERWVSGRGFFVLDSLEHVELLHRSYTWDLTHRLDTQEETEPVRCLSWSAWTQLHELYTAHQRAQSQPTPPQTQTTPKEQWWRGTILLLPLPTTSSEQRRLVVPECGIDELTPALCNRHIKPQLEREVAESITYIHVIAPPPATLAIRVAHPRYAAQLLAHFPELTAMPAADEDAYWSRLPAKVQSSAHTRFLSLEAQLPTHN